MEKHENPTRIASFSVDHDYITPGFYVSRQDLDITTYDMRFRRPNMGDYIDNVTMHSVEHMFATYIRSSKIGERVIYFGPMGCQTGFYLLVRDADNDKVYDTVVSVLKTIAYDSDVMYGASRRECGNYLNLDLECAKRECKRYLEALDENKIRFVYPKE